MTHIRRPTADRQAELTDAALEIIGTRGIAALNTRSLSKYVGLSSGAMFRHFGSLDELFEAVVDRVERVLTSTYPSTDLPPLERLQAFVKARSAAAGRQLGIPRLMLSEQFQLALPDACAVRLQACIAKSRMFVRTCIREGQRNGQIRRDIDARSLAIMVMGTTQMLTLSGANTPMRTSEARDVIQALASLLQNAPPSTHSGGLA